MNSFNNKTLSELIIFISQCGNYFQLMKQLVL